MRTLHPQPSLAHPTFLLCLHNTVEEHVATRVCSVSQCLHQYLECCVNLVPLWCAVCSTCYKHTHTDTHTQGNLFISNSAPLCMGCRGMLCRLHGSHSMCVYQLGSRNCGRRQVTSSSSTACTMCCCLHPCTWHKLITFFVHLKNHPGTPSSTNFFPYRMQLFCFSCGRGSPHRSLSMFLPLRRYHFPVCFPKPECKAMHTHKVPVHI